MIISHSHKFIFLKPRKVGGTSVYIALSELCKPTDNLSYLISHNANFDESFFNPISRCVETSGVEQQNKNLTEHSIAKDVKEIIENTYWNDYSKVSIIRNPWEVEVSRYYWELGNERLPNGTSFSQYMDEHYEKYYHSNEPYYFIDNEMILDFVIRYENLETDYHAFLKSKRLPQNNLPYTKSKTRKEKKHYSLYYEGNEKWINAIRKKNKKTIDYFGFHFENQCN